MFIGDNGVSSSIVVKVSHWCGGCWQWGWLCMCRGRGYMGILYLSNFFVCEPNTAFKKWLFFYVCAFLLLLLEFCHGNKPTGVWKTLSCGELNAHRWGHPWPASPQLTAGVQASPCEISQAWSRSEEPPTWLTNSWEIIIHDYILSYWFSFLL